MKNTLKLEGYTGTVVFDSDDRIFHGRLMGIMDMITFEGPRLRIWKKIFGLPLTNT